MIPSASHSSTVFRVTPNTCASDFFVTKSGKGLVTRDVGTVTPCFAY